MRKVEVVKYRSEWMTDFEQEATCLKSILGDVAHGIYHMGSTAIPHIYAKPIIDLLVAVTDIEAIDNFNEALAQFGYRAHGENGIPNRRYFTKGGDARTHHIHMFEVGNPEIMRHLDFVHYMCLHPHDALQYSALKQQLAKMYPNDVNSYVAGKHDYLVALDEKIVEWKKEREGNRCALSK